MTSGLRPSFVSESSGVCRVFARRAPDVCQASIPDFSGAFFFRRQPGSSSRAVRCRPDLVRVHPASLYPCIPASLHPPLHSAPRILHPASVPNICLGSNPIPATSYRPSVPASAPLGLSYEKASPRRKISAGARLFSEDFRPFGLLLRSFRSASAPRFDLPVRFPVAGFLPTFRCVRCFLSELPSARRRLSGACTACFRVGLSLPQSLHRPCAETVSRESPPSPAAPGCVPSPPPDGFRPRRNAADIPGRCRRYKDRRIPWAMRSTFSARDSR